MPIYEYRCSKCGKVSSFLVRSIASHDTPVCPHCKSKRMSRAVSRFAAVGGKGKVRDKAAAEPAGEAAGAAAGAAAGMDGGMPGGGMPGGGGDDFGGPGGPGGPEPDLAGMEQMLSGIDENDPRSMGRVMRKMAEQTGEPLDGEMEEVVRRLESGEDPEKIEERMGDALGDAGGPGGPGGGGDELYDG